MSISLLFICCIVLQLHQFHNDLFSWFPIVCGPLAVQSKFRLRGVPIPNLALGFLSHLQIFDAQSNSTFAGCCCYLQDIWNWKPKDNFIYQLHQHALPQSSGIFILLITLIISCGILLLIISILGAVSAKRLQQPAPAAPRPLVIILYCCSKIQQQSSNLQSESSSK